MLNIGLQDKGDIMSWQVMSEDDKDLIYNEFLASQAKDKELVIHINNEVLADFEGWHPDDMYYATRDAYMEVLISQGIIIKDLYNRLLIKGGLNA